MALFGIGRQKPHRYREMARIAWENRDQLPFAWRILKDGVCDGCALGTSETNFLVLPPEKVLRQAAFLYRTTNESLPSRSLF